jgi:hypothetical protein
MSILVKSARELAIEAVVTGWPLDLKRGVGGGDNRRLGGAERALTRSPVMTLFGQMVTLVEWQRDAPLTWYHGSPKFGVQYLEAGAPNAHTPFIEVWGVYLSRYVQTARVFGRNVYRVQIPESGRGLLVPDPDIQELTKGDYLAVVYQGDLYDVTQVVDPEELIASA